MRFYHRPAYNENKNGYGGSNTLSDGSAVIAPPVLYVILCLMKIKEMSL